MAFRTSNLQPPTSNQPPTYDAVVVGAGPAGSATAILLTQAGHRVLLVDRARFPRAKPCAEYASPGVESCLARLGVLERVGRSLGRRLRGMEMVAPGGTRFLVQYGQDGQAREGFALPRLELDAELVARARESGVEVWEGFRVTSVVRSGERVVGVEGESRVTARLVIGADGLHSVVARSLGLRGRTRWPRRLGLVAHYRSVEWPEDYGQMWVGANGYVGVAPSGEQRLVVGMALPMSGRRMSSAEAAFEVGLADFPHLAARLARGVRLGPVRGVGPMARSVRRCAGSGYLLVGDAAGFFDPFTGEGIYRALRSAELVALVADEALRLGDLSARRLNSYQALRDRELGPKEQLTRLVQLFVQVPALMDYVLPRLKRRTAPAQTLSQALGDLLPAGEVLRPSTLWGLLRP